jgi:Ras GTPase-activating-like protein IQGAP2/3
MNALRDPATRQLYIHNLRQLRELTNVFMLTIERNVNKIPFGIRYISRQIYQSLKARFSQISDDHALEIVSSFIYYRYLNPAIKAPESWGVVESVPNPQQRKNLSMVSKMLTHIAGGNAFGDEDEVFQSLNDYILHESTRMITIFKQGMIARGMANAVVDIFEPEEHFAIDQFEDLASTQKPTLTIRQSDVKFVHALVSKELEVIVQPLATSLILGS